MKVYDLRFVHACDRKGSGAWTYKKLQIQYQYESGRLSEWQDVRLEEISPEEFEGRNTN